MMFAHEIFRVLYKTNRFHFAVGLYSDNTQRTSKRGRNSSDVTRYLLLCSHHVLTTSVRYQCTDERKNEIYLLNNELDSTNHRKRISSTIL